MPFTDLLVLARDFDARLMGLLRRITVPVCVSP